MEGGKRIRPGRFVRHAAGWRQGRENGAIAIMFAGGLIIIIGFCGLALDLAQVYNRKMELQNAADTAALAATVELNGTAAGINSAASKASARFTAGAPIGLTFQYGKQSMEWSESAISFGTSATGPWLSRSEAAARAAPNGLLYTRVETAGLDPLYGQVTTMFMPILSSALATVSIGARAIAGRSSIVVTPIGLCAMRPEAQRNRSGELEEYGFRRGISYDLMQLNPNATGVGMTFLLNPLAAPGQTVAPATDSDTVASFICTGTMGVARVMGGQVHVASPFPLASYFQHLNSRFDTYTASCSPDSAPPDTNIKGYTYTGGNLPWTTTVPAGQAAALSIADGKRWTVTGPDPTPSGNAATQYGPLWSYAKAAKYASPAPSSGYATYGTGDWSTLYNPGKPVPAGSYPSATPYGAGGSTYGKSPSRRGLSGRRVLNVALLACPVSGSLATVLGIGKFFMTVPADSTHLYAEFGGLAEEQTLRAQVKLYP